MPYRTTPLINDQYYHIYNRGNEKRHIFEYSRDYKRFLKTLTYYQLSGPKPKLSNYFKHQTKIDESDKIVEIVAYCLMPNHFHLLLKQVKDGAITEMLTKLQLSYTKYFNIKYDRVGALFQGQFKSVLVESDEQLIHLLRYIHLNPIASFLVNDLNNYEWSSHKEYLGKNDNNVCVKDIILGNFKSLDKYNQFILDQVNYAQSLENIKHQIIEKI